MSEEQLSAFLEAVKADVGLQERLKGASDPAVAIVIAKEAGFEISEADWLKHQAHNILTLNDEDLESVAGGWGTYTLCGQSQNSYCNCCM
jgi:predicted ribosomally synthesized peptide with nif11-like leader